MNYLLGPLIERIVVQDVLAGRQPHPDDVKIAAEWMYRIWRKSGRPTEINVVEESRPRSRIFDWFFS